MRDRETEDDGPGSATSGLTIRNLLRRRAAEAGTAVAVYESDGRTSTYSDLQEFADDVGDGLPAPGARVALRIPNTAAGVAAVHSIWQRGCSVVPLGPALPEREVDRRLAETGCAALVEVDGQPRVRDVTGAPTAAGENEALVIFTSGTTGRPKGAALGFHALSGSVGSIAAAVGMTDGRAPRLPPRSPSPTFMPLAHIAGFLSTVTAMHLGKPSLIVDRWRVEDVFDLVKRFELTLLRLAPAMLHDLVHVRGHRSLEPVKTISVGSAPLNPAVHAAVEERYRVVVLNSYGQTELCGAIAFERYEDVTRGIRPPGSVGRVAPGVRVRIVDEEGHDVEPGGVGEIWARGRGAMDAYVHEGRALDPRRDGWIPTGDLGRIDEQGFVYIMGRVRDVIVCGGFNVYPAVVEAALMRLPGVTDAAIVGLPDDRLGEVPVAAVVVDASPAADADLMRLLRQDVAAYELPRQLVRVERIPRNEGGKPDGDAVRTLITMSARMP